MYTEAAALFCLGWFVFIAIVCAIGYVQLQVTLCPHTHNQSLTAKDFASTASRRHERMFSTSPWMASHM